MSCTQAPHIHLLVATWCIRAPRSHCRCGPRTRALPAGSWAMAPYEIMHPASQWPAAAGRAAQGASAQCRSSPLLTPCSCHPPAGRWHCNGLRQAAARPCLGLNWRYRAWPPYGMAPHGMAPHMAWLHMAGAHMAGPHAAGAHQLEAHDVPSMAIQPNMLTTTAASQPRASQPRASPAMLLPQGCSCTTSKRCLHRSVDAAISHRGSRDGCWQHR